MLSSRLESARDGLHTWGYRLLALQRLQSLSLRRQGATLALKAQLCFLRPCDISCSFPTATAALSLGAGLSLAYLSEIPGPPQTAYATSSSRLPEERISVMILALHGMDTERPSCSISKSQPEAVTLVPSENSNVISSASNWVPSGRVSVGILSLLFLFRRVLLIPSGRRGYLGVWVMSSSEPSHSEKRLSLSVEHLVVVLLVPFRDLFLPLIDVFLSDAVFTNRCEFQPTIGMPRRRPVWFR